MSCHSPTMLAAGCLLLTLFCLQVSCVPLSTKLSEEEEKVVKCIWEVLDSKSKPISKECWRIINDERIISKLYREHLFKTMEELNHRGNSIRRFGHEAGHGGWEKDEDDSEENELKKRNQEAGAVEQRDAEKRGTTAAAEGNGKEVKTRGSESKRDQEDIKEVEKTEKIEEKVKEEKVSHAEDDTKLRMEEAKELLEDDDEDEEDEEEEKKKKKRNAPEKRSREYFEFDKRKEDNNGERGVALSEILEKLSKDAHHATKKMAEAKKHFSDEDSSMEEDYHHDGFHNGHHGGHHREHENWEDEEFEKKRSGTQQRSVNKRMDEKASDEETAQFEAEEKGVKISNVKSHLHGTHEGDHLSEKPWEDKRHFHHHQGESQEDELMKKRHFEEEPYIKNHHEKQEEEREEEEIEEREEMKKEELELENLEDIEYELKKAAEKLRELHRG